MARHPHEHLHRGEVGLAGGTLLAVVLLVALLVLAGWRSGLLTLDPDRLAVRLPEIPSRPERSPNPNPPPIPRPGPGVER
ncbi:MAG: hypothetical protein J7521_15620 [Caulobacter sp.]|nr:hypothetical protein [Caulobacter sp.]